MNLYESLHVNTLINAWDTISSVGGSLMENDVLDVLCAPNADEEADAEFLKALGIKLAALCKTEAACITPGSSAAIFCAAYAAIQKSGSRDVVMMCSHRNHYDPAIRVAGGRIRQVGITWVTEEWELTGALTERPAAVLFVASEKHSKYGIPLKRCAELAHLYSVPVFVDAAAQVPPAENLYLYREQGADLVFFSGGKAVRGPQSVGFAVGTAEQISQLDALRQDERFALLMPIGKAEALALTRAVEKFVDTQYADGCYSNSKRLATRFAQILSESGLYSVNILPRTRLGQTVYNCEAKLLREELRDAVDTSLRQHGIMIGRAAEDNNTYIMNPLLLTSDQIDKIAQEMTEV